MGIGLGAEPMAVVSGSEDGRHPVMDRSDQFVGWSGQDSEGADPFPLWVLPILPNSGDAEGRAILHRDRVRLLASPRRSPLIKCVDGQDTSSPLVGIAEGGQCRYGF